MTQHILKGKRVFAFDDESYNLGILQMYLQLAGAIHKFEQFDPATKGIAKLKQNLPIDIVLMDYNLGVKNINGIEVFQLMQQDPDLQGIPVVLVSALDKMQEAMDAGMAGFIGKPIDKEIVEYILQILSGKPIWLRYSR